MQENKTICPNNEEVEDPAPFDLERGIFLRLLR